LQCIVILSDANAAFQLPQNEPRQKFLCVGGMTLAETTAIFNQRGKLLMEDSTAAHALAPEDAAANKALLARLHESGVTTGLVLSHCAAALPAGANARDPAVAAVVEAVILDAQVQAAADVADLAAANTAMPYRVVRAGRMRR
jgi:hypothetical protein